MGRGQEPCSEPGVVRELGARHLSTSETVCSCSTVLWSTVLYVLVEEMRR